MNVLVVSFNFNPGHFSHLIANYNLFLDGGFKPYLYVNKAFNKMDECHKYEIINDFKQIKKLKTVGIAVFWFPSFFNILEIGRLRMFYNSKIVYIFHEPFDSVKNYYSSGFGTIKILKIFIVNLINIILTIFAHKIILPSSKAFNLYKKNYTIFNKNFLLLPLIFDDEAVSIIQPSHKKYISYIGAIAADHAFDCYIQFVESCMKYNWFPELSFLIASKDNIPTKERKIIEPYLSQKRITISEGRPMLNSEINGYFNDSLIVWNAYHRSMQSGVLPKAYMFGAAIIGTHHCNSEFIDNHVTGVLVKDNSHINEIKSAVEEVHDKKEFFFQNCRNKFFESFYYKKRKEDFISFLEN